MSGQQPPPTFSAVLPDSQGGQPQLQQQQQQYPPPQLLQQQQQQQQQQQPEARSVTSNDTPPGSIDHMYSTTAWNLARKAHLDNQMLVTKTTDVETEDGRISNREAAEKIKDAWMYKQIRARRDEFTHYRQVRRWCMSCVCLCVCTAAVIMYQSVSCALYGCFVFSTGSSSISFFSIFSNSVTNMPTQSTIVHQSHIMNHIYLNTNSIVLGNLVCWNLECQCQRQRGIPRWLDLCRLGTQW